MTFLVGGETEVLERVRPVLEASASHIVHTGEVGTGQIAKVANNLMLWAQYAGTRESITLVENNGLDAVWLRTVLLHSTGNTWPLQHWDGFQDIPWARKDLETVQQFADENALDLPVSAFLSEYMRK